MNTTTEPHNFHNEMQAASTVRERQAIYRKVPLVSFRPWKDLLEVQRTKVCDSCGGKLNISNIANGGCCDLTYRSRTIICRACSKIASPVTPEEFNLANRLVREFGYRPYSHMSESEYRERQEKNPHEQWLEYFFQSQVGGAYDIIRWLREQESK